MLDKRKPVGRVKARPVVCGNCGKRFVEDDYASVCRFLAGETPYCSSECRTRLPNPESKRGQVIIAGSRDVCDYELVRKAFLTYPWEISQVISGGARGADYLGEMMARLYRVPCKIMPAEWEKYGKRAGYIRNTAMAEEADGLIAIWDGRSRGTKSMLDIARSKGLRIWLVIYR